MYKSFALSILSLCLLAAGPARAADPGRTVMAFLEVGVDARAAAMGGAYTAVTRDASATYWNPAALVDIDRTDILGMHNEWIQDLRQEYVAGALHRGRHGFGFAFVGMFADGIDGRDEFGGETPDFGLSDIAVSGSYAFAITEDFAAGGTARYMRESFDAVVRGTNGFDGASMSGVGFDLGLTWDTPVDNLRAAGALRHLGSELSYDVEGARSFELPTTMQLGLAYVWPGLGGGRLTIAADAVAVKGDDGSIRMGTEYAIKNFLALAVGYKTGLDNEDLSFGVGYTKNLRVYYAYTPIDSDLGSSHRFSVGYMW